MAIQWQNTVGQERIKGTFDRALAGGQLGHAYLFAGKPGVGKFSLALEIALALLCDAEQKPCYECPSCRKVLGHSHPDFRYLFPLNFAAEHKVKGQAQKLTEAGWDFISSEIKAKLNEPYKLHTKGGVVPVDWIREVNHSIQRGATENGYTVVIIEGIESFRAESANAMLKTLEEPPPQTVMILLTESVHQVLPTIKSRCQIHRFGAIEPAPLKQELTKRFPEQTAEIDRVASLCYGSLGKALTLMDTDSESDEVISRFFTTIFEDRDKLNRALGLELFVEEALGKEFPLGMAIVNALIEEIRFAFLHRYTGEAEFIFSAAAAQRLRNCSPEQIEQLLANCEDALLSLKRHTPMLMVFVNLTLQLSEIIDE